MKEPLEKVEGYLNGTIKPILREQLGSPSAETLLAGLQESTKEAKAVTAKLVKVVGDKVVEQKKSNKDKGAAAANKGQGAAGGKRKTTEETEDESEASEEDDTYIIEVDWEQW